MVQRRPGRGEEVLGSSSDSGTHGCVAFHSLLNLSEPQILRLIWELEGTIPWQGFNESSVRMVPDTLGAGGGQTLSLSAWGALAQHPGSRGQIEKDPGRGSVGPASSLGASSLGSKCDQPQHKTIKMLITREPATQ